MEKSLCKCGRQRDSELKRCAKCREIERKSKQRCRARRGPIEAEYQRGRWAHRMVCHSRDADKKRKRPVDSEDYITPSFLEMIRRLQHNSCKYCGTGMQDENRREPNGLTVERFHNDLPHLKQNVCLACYRCNMRSRGPTHRAEFPLINRSFRELRQKTRHFKSETLMTHVLISLALIMTSIWSPAATTSGRR